MIEQIENRPGNGGTIGFAVEELLDQGTKGIRWIGQEALRNGNV